MIIAYIGKMRSGKTYAMTERVLKELKRGRVVYTNYKVNWNPEEPMSKPRLILHRLGFKKKRYPKTNLRLFRNWEDVMGVAGAVIALDEGWQYFDSYQKLPMEKRMRLYQSGKWEIDFLYTVQRYMMTDINLRWSTDEFWESTLYKIPFTTTNLIIYRLYDLDEDNDTAKLARKGIQGDGEVVDLAIAKRFKLTKQKIYNAYDTKEDIYATEESRATLSQKTDVRSSDTRPYYDRTPTYWNVLVKYVNRRFIRTKKRSALRRKSTLVERFRRRNHVIHSNVVARSMGDGIVKQKVNVAKDIFSE